MSQSPLPLPHTELTMEPKQLQLDAVIGFEGSVQNGLIFHPDGQHLIYPLGQTIVIRDLSTSHSQRFLHGHGDRVSTVTLSPCGRYLASGQVTHMGFTAPILVWDFETGAIIHKLELHKVLVQGLAFSTEDEQGRIWLASIGGQDDCNLVIWNAITGEPLCGSPAANDLSYFVKFFNSDPYSLVTGGSYNIRVWSLDVAQRKIRPTDCNIGQLRRVFTCCTIDDDDQTMYCGTATGDVLQVGLSRCLMRNVGPKTRFANSVTSIVQTPSGHLIVGAGDGALAVVEKSSLKVCREEKVQGKVTSLTLGNQGHDLFVGTAMANIYYVPVATFTPELRNTCHHTGINDVCFPNGYSELFATSGGSDIRVWNSRNCVELLRIQVPNIEVHCICFSMDGTQIISGWSDGKVRAFGPQSGKLLFVINDAHVGGCTAVACMNDVSQKRIITGGTDGQVRVWQVTKQSQTMVASLKDHAGTVNSIQVRGNDCECVSASNDGSCIIYNLQVYKRSASLQASTFFKGVMYHPDESQIVTCGTDRKVTYWDPLDGSAIRVLDASEDEIMTIAITSEGEYFASGGADKLVKIWHYDEGVCHFIGVGHSASITKLAISPDQGLCVSVGDEGAICIWAMGVEAED
jgi:WD40 repeat protein